MQPGENRWVGLAINAPSGKEGETLPVYIYEMVEGKPVNGFALGVQLASIEDSAKANIQLHRSEFARVLAAHRIKEAGQEVETALKLLKQDKISSEEYVKYLDSRLASIKSIVSELIKSLGDSDSFAIKTGFDELAKATGSGNTESAAVAHTSFLNRLDAALTQHHLTKGDVADILQNVRWQEVLFKTRALPELKCAKSIVKSSHDFIAAYSMRKLSNKDYPEFMKRNMPCLTETAEHPATQNLDLKKWLAAIAKSFGDLRELQKNHREFLLQLQTIKEKQ